jgi:hypothetical protein
LKNNAQSFKTFFIIYEKYIKTAFELHVESCKKYANIILPNFEINEQQEIETDQTLDFLLINLKNLKRQF